MLDAIFLRTNYQGLKKMLDATVMRHEAIASNIANVETPNYKRIDVESSFSSELSKAIESKSIRDIQRAEPRIVVDRTANAPNRDGNTVQLEKELLALQQNSMAHHLQTQLVSSAIHKIKSAISGRNA